MKGGHEVLFEDGNHNFCLDVMSGRIAFSCKEPET